MKIKYGWYTDCGHFTELTDDDSSSTLIDVVYKLMAQFGIDNWQSDYKTLNDEDTKFIELYYPVEGLGYNGSIRLYKDILMDINSELVRLPYWNYNEH